MSHRSRTRDSDTMLEITDSVEFGVHSSGYAELVSGNAENIASLLETWSELVCFANDL